MIKWICMFAFYFYSVVYSKFNLQKVTRCSCVWHSTLNSAFFPVLSFPCPLFLAGPPHSYLCLTAFFFHKHCTLLTCFWERIPSTFLPRYSYEGFSWDNLLVCRLGCLTGDGPLATHSNWNILDLISPSEWFTFFHLSLSSNLWLFACCFYRVGERYSLLPQMEQSCMTFQWPYRHCCLVSLSSAQTTHS